MADDNFLKVLDKLSEIHADVSVTKNELQHIKEDVSRNTKDLEIHIKNSNTNTQRLNMEIKERSELSSSVTNINDRVVKLEIPKKVKAYIRSGILALGALAGAIYAILRLCGISII